MLELIAVLPQEFAARHLVLMQLPGGEDHRAETHEEGKQVRERDAEYDALLAVPAEQDEGHHDPHDHPEQNALQPLGTNAAALQLGHLADEVLVLILNPRL